MQKAIEKRSEEVPARLRDPNVAKAIESQVERRTKGHIRMLRVTVGNGRVTVHGQAGSSYYKELALLAAMEVIGRHDPDLVELNILSGAKESWPFRWPRVVLS